MMKLIYFEILKVIEYVIHMIIGKRKDRNDETEKTES